MKLTRLNSLQLVLKYLDGSGPAEEEEIQGDVATSDDLEDFFSKLTADTDLDPNPDEDVDEDLDPESGGDKGGEPDVEVKPAGKQDVPAKPADTPAPTEQPTEPKPADPAPEPAPAPATQEPKAPTQEEQEAQLAVFRGALEQQYALTDEDAEAVLTDPKGTLPRLMANVHMQMMSQFAQMLQVVVPQILDVTTKQTQTKQTINDQFAARWPDIAADTAGKDTVIAAIRTVKAAHPTATIEQVIEKVGPVYYALTGKTPAAPAPAPAPAAIVKPPKARPHTPARSVVTPPKPATTGNNVVDFINTLLDQKD